MSKINEIMENVFNSVPGVIGVILTDNDGIHIEKVGEFQMEPNGLGALLSACCNSYSQVGLEFNQELNTVLVGYKDMKLCQCRNSDAILTVIANGKSYLGLIMLEAKKAMKEISAVMEKPESENQEVIESFNFKTLDEQDIDDILSKLKTIPEENH